MNRPFAIGILLVWLAAIVGVGASGLLYAARGPVLAPIVWGPVLVFVAAFTFSVRVRAWALTINPRPLVLFHLVRFIGIAFLILHGQGRLPAAFALPAGWGDIAVAATAPLAALGLPARTAMRRRLLLAWNAVGLGDTLFAVFTAMRLRLRNPVDMAAITVFPLSLVSTFIVPLLLMTHFVLLTQLWQQRGRVTGSGSMR